MCCRVLFSVILALGFLPAASAVRAYTLPNSQVLPLHSASTGQDYLLYVSLPRDYAQDPKKRYPVIYTLDADYSFAIAANTTGHFADRGDMPPVIVVSIAYPGGISDMHAYQMNRTRDYTPTHSPEGGYGPESQAVSGGGPKFRDFIVNELIPYVESHYQADGADRTLVGHSYGGLFTTYMLLTRPQAFHRYIIVSPSLWYDKRMIYADEEAYATGHRDLPAKVFFGVGKYENQSEYAMADDMQLMVKQLKSRDYPHLQVTDYVFDQETHNSVFPGALSRGLREVFSDWPGMH